MIRNKKYALELLKEKVNGEKRMTYREISRLTGYHSKSLIRLSGEIEKKDIENLLVHGLTGKVSNRSVPDLEIKYIVNFKTQYPEISISQFMDIYHEDVIWNKNKINDVKEHNLKLRSYSFFKQLYKNQGWKSPIRHRKFGKLSESHPLRDPSPNRGMLVIIDGTPHDWFNNGKKQSLHLAIDDATGEVLVGWFMTTECLEGYCHLLKMLIIKHGIPENFYSDRYSVFYNPDDKELTQFGRMCKQLGINMIFANTPEAKGKVERMNFTIQNRLLNDIKRYNITTVEQLNKWFNSYYIKYINRKFAYKPKYEELLFITPDFKKLDLSLIFCRKVKRIILNGNVISYNNNYYQIVDIDYQNYPMFKGTEVIVLIDIFDSKIVRIEYRKKVFNTKLIDGHRNNPVKHQIKINNQKELERLIDERYENEKTRENEMSLS